MRGFFALQLRFPAITHLLTYMDVEGPRASEGPTLTYMANARRGGDHTGSPSEPSNDRVEHLHTPLGARACGGYDAAGESYAGSNRCARSEGELASGSDGPRLP